MQTDFLILSGGSAAVRLKAPTDVERIPTHIILMIDVSESMLDDHKLENVKTCCQLLLTFLNDADSVSLITFGENAHIHLKCVAATEANKSAAQDVIRRLTCDGCTNLSAGLGHVEEVYRASSLKTGLLILTDGHANRGVSDPSRLRQMIEGFRERYTNLSTSCVAYGTDHNADLLRGIAEDVQGAYTIVQGVEDTAMAFGDTLGGLMSCAFQNVVLEVPKDTMVHGPYKSTVEGERRRIQIGDVYAGTKPLILLDIPEEHIQSVDAVVVRGNKLPELVGFQHSLIPEPLEQRDIDIDLTRHRYTCTQILQSVQQWAQLSEEERQGLTAQIDALDASLGDAAFHGHPVTTLLRGEIQILRDSLERLRTRQFNAEDHATLTQHGATVGLARGFSSPNPRRHRHRSWGPSSDPTDIDEDTVNVFQNGLQATMSMAMRVASQHAAE